MRKSDKLNHKVCARSPRPPQDSVEEAIQAFAANQGYDPILGAPFPPTNFQLVVAGTNPTRLEWNLPELMILGEGDEVALRTAYIRLLNFNQDPTTASQSGSTVTLSPGGYVFIDTASNAGQKICWAGGVSATIVTVVNATTATVSDSKTVGAASFAILPANTVFELYATDVDGDPGLVTGGDETAFRGDSIGTLGFGEPGAYDTTWDAGPVPTFTIVFEDFGFPPGSPETSTIYFVIKAVAGDIEIWSNVIVATVLNV